MADKYFFSTLSADTAYSKVSKRADGSYDLAGTVVIKGGANVADSHFVTAQGVMTRVSEESYEAIKDDGVLAIHVANGFVKIEDAPADVEKVVADMEGRDASAPLTENDYGDNDPEAAQPVATKKSRRG